MKRRLPVDIEFLMESILSEDPDVVYDMDNEEIAIWHNKGAVAFICYNHFDAACIEGKHSTIDYVLRDVVKERIATSAIELFGKTRGVGVSPISGLAEELKTNEKFKNHMTGINIDDYRHLGISGRAWPEKKILSFWNKRKAVIENWDRVVRMFDDPMFKGVLGNLEDYQVDFLERIS